MSDLIRREDARKKILGLNTLEYEGIMCVGNCTYLTKEEILYAIDDIPSAEPERKKGYWTEDSDPGQIIGEHYSCSECRACFGTLKSNYCPNCGADMRGDHE